MKAKNILVLLGTICMFVLPGPVAGQTNFGEYGGATFIGVIDARTIILDLPEYPALIGEKIRVRINGLQTPDLKGKCKKETRLAQKAKRFTEKFLKEAEIIDLTNMTRGNYFQIVADVLVNDEEFAPNLIKKGYAFKTARNKKPQNWCK